MPATAFDSFYLRDRYSSAAEVAEALRRAHQQSLAGVPDDAAPTGGLPAIQLTGTPPPPCHTAQARGSRKDPAREFAIDCKRP